MPEGAGSGTRGAWFPRWFWPSFAAPATLWLIVFFVMPFYVILAIAFGQLDQIFLTPIPVYNPLHWNGAEVDFKVDVAVSRKGVRNASRRSH